MLKATANLDGPPLTVNASASGVAVYLDNHSIIDLAKGDTKRRERFVAAIQKGGDLIFSLANVAELTGPQFPSSIEPIRMFLDDIGPRWFPVELDPYVVANRIAGPPY